MITKDLPVESTELPETIRAGEIMCWSSNSLVLFYHTFSNSYSGYVRIGYIKDVTGLASALGRGNVEVTFSLCD
ncbi:cyclophilin-like fold protein [Paenibacillus piri]|uniref:cyclophilin-like fold protein n=1 Tax=Paenibacillus piri TaxID=2547395 RepID=UPI001404EAE2